jgi:hypothetical protein
VLDFARSGFPYQMMSGKKSLDFSSHKKWRFMSTLIDTMNLNGVKSLFMVRVKKRFVEPGTNDQNKRRRY